MTDKATDSVSVPVSETQLEQLVVELCQCVEKGDEKSVLNILDIHTTKYDEMHTQKLVNTPYPDRMAGLWYLHERTALMYAAHGGHEAIADILIRHGADVNAGNKFGCTGLMYAGKNGHGPIADMLIGHGADVNAKDSYDNTALMFAARGGHGSIADYPDDVTTPLEICLCQSSVLMATICEKLQSRM
jgi:Ankyrin repeats (3 copies)